MSDSIKSNIELQLTEIEILQSIYSNTDEFFIEDMDAFAEAQFFVSNECDLFTRNLGFIIKIDVDIENKESEENIIQLPIEIVCRLSTNYPLSTTPNIFVRCSKQNINRKFTEDLKNFINNAHSNDSSVLEIVEWIKENLQNYLNKSNSNRNESGVSNSLFNLSRMWIYSHHIYSVNKRKSIIQWAKNFDLDGFSKPGKPGIICVEGEQNNVQDFWTQLRTVPWQKIQIKELEEFQFEISKLKEYKKFTNFEEMVFNADHSDNHIDNGLLFAFLKEKGLKEIFYLYFGVNGKLPDSPPTK